MDFISDELSSEPEINMTPLIDVVFIMLIFFMLTTSFSKSSGIEVQLPEAESASVIDLGDAPFIISIDKDGNLATPDGKTTAGDLETALSTAKARDPMVELIIQADKSSAHGRVVEMLDIAQKLQILNISVETQ